MSGTTYSVTGSHHYRGFGSHTITTTVTEIGSAAELLQAKVGDEVPGLPDHHGNSTSATMTITGAGFDETVTVEFVGPGGAVQVPSDLRLTSTNVLTLTLDLPTWAVGMSRTAPSSTGTPPAESRASTIST